jgi:hypothetical protein
MKTGHVILYCNESIVLIDFSILDNKKYSFFIGEEFIELDLEKDLSKKQKFNYKLKINKEANTSLNKLRKISNKKDNILAACLGLAFFLTIGITCYIMLQ